MKAQLSRNTMAKAIMHGSPDDVGDPSGKLFCPYGCYIELLLPWWKLFQVSST